MIPIGWRVRNYRMKNKITIIGIFGIVIFSVFFCWSRNSKLLPSESDIDYIEVTYGIADDDPTYYIDSIDSINKIFNITSINRCKEINYILEDSPLEYITFVDGPYHWLVGISENQAGVVCYAVSVYKNDAPILSRDHFYTPKEVKTYDYVIKELKKITME